MQPFTDAAARVHRVRADFHDVVNMESQHRAIHFHRHRRIHHMTARVDVADEGLQPVRDELDRAAEQHRRGRDRDFVVVEVQLHAKRTADIRHDDPNIGFRQAEQFGVNGAHLVRHLRRLVHRESPQGGIELREDGARLERHARVARDSIYRNPIYRRRNCLLKNNLFPYSPEASVSMQDMAAMILALPTATRARKR